MTALCLWVFPLTVLAAAEDVLAAKLAACAAVSEAAERLDCFDTLAESIVERAGHAAGEQAIPPLVDAVGKRWDDEDAPPDEFAGRVESCEKRDASGRVYFTFDNGQIWRQSNTGRLPFRECDFAVTLKRDAFGYKLQVPSENRSVRVTRVR